MAYVAAGSTPPAGELESINSHHPLEADSEMGDGIAMGFGIDAGMAAARFMFDIIKKYYLVKVFPECARKLQLLNDEGKEYGFKTCPPTILRTIISFVIQYCLDSNEFNSPLTHTSPATPILKSIVYSSESNREIMHEIVRQGLSLPPAHPQYKDIVRGAIHIVGVWCLSSEEERPVFLRSTFNRTQLPYSASSTTVGMIPAGQEQTGPQTPTPQEPYAAANSFLLRYFQLLTKVFSTNAASANDFGSNSSSEALGSTAYHTKVDPDALFNLYKDIIGLFRAIMARGQIEMDSKSWEALLRSLLEIQSRIMAMQEKNSTPMSSTATDELAALIVETVLCAYSRCPNVPDALWVELRTLMIESLRWPQVVAQWARWSLRLTHILAHEVFQVDLESVPARPAQAAAARHSRKMSDKFRHSRFHASKADNTMRHSIGGELLSSQGIPYSYYTYPVHNVISQDRSTRRANSVHYDPAKQGSHGGGSGASHSNTNGSSMYAPTLLGHMGFLPNRDLTRDYHTSVKADTGDGDDDDSSDPVGSHFSTFADMMDTNDEKLSRASSLSFHGPDSLHLDPIVERLSSLYGIFASPEYLNVSMKGRSPQNIMSTWKNIVCSIGNPNKIQIPLVKTEVMLCLIDVWDLLNLTRSSQPLDATLIPPLYDFAPWFFEAAKSSSDGGLGLPAIYGGLCRMMSRRYDQDFSPENYELFYSSIIQGLQIDDALIGQSILANSSRIFTLSLPGSHVLAAPYLTAIRQMLLKDDTLRDGISHYIRKQAIAILSSICMRFYDFQNPVECDNAWHPRNIRSGYRYPKDKELFSHKKTFTRLVLDLTTAEANVKPLGKFWDTHSMLIQLCGMLVVNEWSSTLISSDIETENELLGLVLDHLYWTEASIVQSALEVITTLAGMYQDYEDNCWFILEMVLSHLLSAMQEHLRLFQGDPRRGAMLGSFFRCLTEWLMVIPPNIFSETELAKWVFELIEVGLLSSPEVAESERKRVAAALQAKQPLQQLQHQNQALQNKPLPRPNKKRGPSFRNTGKPIHQHHRVMISTGPAVDVELEQQLVKDAAETTLTHLVHFLNSGPSFFGSGDKSLLTLGLESGPDGHHCRVTNKPSPEGPPFEVRKVFALNDSILIVLEEIPCALTGIHRTRVTIRDETGRYAWDSEIFYRETLQYEAPSTSRPRSAQRASSRLSERFGASPRRRKKEMASQLVWREGVKIRQDELHRPVSKGGGRSPVPSGNSPDHGSDSHPTFDQAEDSYEVEPPIWDGSRFVGDGDMLDQLLHYIGERHPDCLFDGKTPLNQLDNGIAISSAAQRHSFAIEAELDRHVQEEHYYTRISDPQARAWYDKLVELRSSLVQTDDDPDEYYGSNTLMSIVSTNWGADDPNGARGPDGERRVRGSEEQENGTQGTCTAENGRRARRYSGLRIRHDPAVLLSELVEEEEAEGRRENGSGERPSRLEGEDGCPVEGRVLDGQGVPASPASRA
ncbi:hypothetical protein BGW38_003560 [Lunasporangiospora selenospora]|uniref:Ral GTPase-activating protein subunit alpha/beta N-terminal domain-containing protein n=1 Tax=Lunasporangiospora selenospora TaxID=979761 RepID=A0A9P6KC41_9FUNG|nr:hypothetical protein BGW38_003560 [Lunasporangiospora selenospora]